MEQTKTLKNKPLVADSEYDIIAELTVAQFNLDLRDRTADFLDKKHFFAEWWFMNKSKFLRYKNLSKLGELLKIHHATVIHLLRHRKKSHKYIDNIQNIQTFLYDNQ
tara:strand:- start:10554 stop:10874 length:321 start_codon:yes stop_codon:yes gene_type:complete